MTLGKFFLLKNSYYLYLFKIKKRHSAYDWIFLKPEIIIHSAKNLFSIIEIKKKICQEEKNYFLRF